MEERIGLCFMENLTSLSVCFEISLILHGFLIVDNYFENVRLMDT